MAAKQNSVWVSPTDSKEMVYVPTGEFLMGTLEGAEDVFDREKPRHRVYLDAYWMDRTPVTVEEYRRHCHVTGRQMPAAPEWGWQEDHPVVNVTWDDAFAYAAWAEKRLPTEAEWEKAARGTHGREYPWGNQWDPQKCATSAASGLAGTRPVGSYPAGASPYGALDMAGNVWEWCADWYDDEYYRSAPARNPTGPASGEYRALRGGSFAMDDPRNFRCASRPYYDPDYRLDSLGFRCVQGLP